MTEHRLGRRAVVAAMAIAGAFLTATAGQSWAADTYNPTCFRPTEGVTKTLSIKARPGPYRLALVNGFVGNSWRIQMIQGLKAWAADPAEREEHQGAQDRQHGHRRGRPDRRCR